jgi:predicted amidohydrolase YtcJ
LFIFTEKISNYYDSHLHLLGLGYIKSVIDLTELKSINLLTKITSDKDIIIGRGWHQADFIEKRYLNKEDLNKISRDKPIIFTRVCGHVLVCNDKAMEIAGINEGTPQIEGQTFNFKTGVFTEDALGLINSIIPKPSKEDIKEMFIQGNNELMKYNITKCASDDFSTLSVPYELIIECLEELYDDDKLQVELYEQVNLPSKELLLDYINKGYHKKKFKGFRMGPLKLLADGSLGGRTAYLREDYSDDPGNRGIKVFKDEDLEELIYIADSNSIDVAIHAIGDGMIDIVLNAIEKSISKTKRFDHRHSIIHAQLADRKQIQRMKQIGVSAIVQPIFLNSDIAIVKERLGEERAKETYLFHTMYKEGIKVGFSTDAPVEGVSPEDNIYCAMNRRSIKNPELGEFLPDEKFTYEEAIECYTKNNWLSYDE